MPENDGPRETTEETLKQWRAAERDATAHATQRDPGARESDATR